MKEQTNLSVFIYVPFISTLLILHLFRLPECITNCTIWQCRNVIFVFKFKKSNITSNVNPLISFKITIKWEKGPVFCLYVLFSIYKCLVRHHTLQQRLGITNNSFSNFCLFLFQYIFFKYLLQFWLLSCVKINFAILSTYIPLRSIFITYLFPRLLKC